MAIYKVPCGKNKKELEFELNEKNVIFNALPVEVDEIPDKDIVITEGFNNTIGTGKLEEIVQPNMKIVVIVDDITRPTPKKILLPEVLKRLEMANVPKDNIKIIIGLGTHRKMTEEEINKNIGKKNIEGYSLINIDYKDKDRFVNFGESKNGTPIEVYKEVLQADFKIAIGNIVPHIAAGWGGGAKMIQPAVCSEKTTEVTHLKACTIQNVLEVCGNADNKVRHEMEDIAGKVGLDFIVNTVLDENKNILGLFCGDYIKAHRKGIELAEKVMCPKIPEKADILITSAYPSDIDFWQGCKPYIYSQFGVKEGGVLIYVIEGEEGLCGNAPHHEKTLRKWSLVPFEKQLKAVENGEVEDIVGINVPLFHSKVRNRVKTICISSGLSVEDKQDLGFKHAESIDEAIDLAYELMGRDAKVGIIPYCGETLVRI